jgi:septal ring factor EnvC (AmiA/AmiB activator)
MSAEIQSSIDNLNYQIRQNENRISDLNREISDLRTEHSQAEDAEQRHARAAAGFQSDEDSNRRSVFKISTFCNVKLTQGYADNITGALGGAENSGATDALDNIRVRIRNTIEQLEHDIRSKEAEICSREDQNSYLRRQISDLNAQLY